MPPTTGLFFTWVVLYLETSFIGLEAKLELTNYLIVENSGSENICNSDGIKVTKGLSALSS